MKAAIYLRQSLDVAGDELGIERQRGECERLCNARGWDVVETVVDNSVSASKHGRKGYAHLLDLITKRAIEVVVILRVDRLLRLNDELEALVSLSESTGVKVATVEGDIDLSTPSGRLMARVLVSVARAEMETKSSRHKLANAQKAAAGKPHGSRRPYGYESDLVTLYEPEAALLREMGRQVITGHSYKHVAWWMNRQGHTTTLGRLWYPLTVRNMLLKPRYGGIREYNGAQYPATWQGVFDAETWDQLQLAMRSRKEAAPSRTQNARRYLLTGISFCGKCGMSLTGTLVKDRHDKKRNRTILGGHIYACRGQRDTGLTRGCGGVRRNAIALDHFIREAVLFRLDTPDLTSMLGEGSSKRGHLRELLSDRQSQQRRLDSFVDDYATGLLTKDQLTRAKATAEAELARIDSEIDKLRRESLAVDIPVGQTLHEAWAKNDDEWRRDIIGLLIKKITVHPGITKPYYMADGVRCRFDPSLIEIDWLA